MCIWIVGEFNHNKLFRYKWKMMLGRLLFCMLVILPIVKIQVTEPLNDIAWDLNINQNMVNIICGIGYFMMVINRIYLIYCSFEMIHTNGVFQRQSRGSLFWGGLDYSLNSWAAGIILEWWYFILEELNELMSWKRKTPKVSRWGNIANPKKNIIIV
jgi:hypothetical protein